jgi:hypothetical protein
MRFAQSGKGSTENMKEKRCGYLKSRWCLMIISPI